MPQVSTRNELNCAKRDLQQTLGGSYDVTPAGENGGHSDFNFAMTNPTELTTGQMNALSPNQSQVVPTSSYRIDTPMGVLHVEPLQPFGVGDSFFGMVHIDLYNPDDGIWGLMGHVFVDGIWGHIVQFFGGNIDKGC